MTLADKLRGEKLVVLGSRGFLGRYVVQALSELADGPEWIALGENPDGSRLEANNQTQLWQGLDSAKPTTILNLIGRTHGSPEEMKRDHVQVAQNLADWVLQNPELKTKVVSLGSAAEYGVISEGIAIESAPCDPISPYGQTKLAATKLLTKCLPSTAIIARPSNIVGAGISPKQLVGSLIHQMVSKKQTVTVTSKTPIRDYIHAMDAAEAVLHLCACRDHSGIFNVSSEIGTSNEEIVQILQEVSGVNVEIEETSPENAGVSVFIADSAKMWAVTGFHPDRSLRSAIEEAWRFACG